MTPQELDQWLDRMGKLRGKDRLPGRDAAEMLGCSREFLRLALAGRGTPKYIDYACKWLEQEAKAGRLWNWKIHTA